LSVSRPVIAAIHQPQYLPWLGYFAKMDQADVFILLDDVQFKKNDWQNRNRIRTPQGWQWLTVPVRHRFGQTVAEVEIDRRAGDDWARRHRKALWMNYAKAPFFERWRPFFDRFYTARWERLVDLNIEGVKALAGMLGIQTPMVLASEFRVRRQGTGRLIDLCRAVGADTYLAGADGNKYMDRALFDASGLRLVFQEFAHPVYRQQWAKGPEDFVSRLSVVDLLFNHGQDSLNVLRGEQT